MGQGFLHLGGTFSADLNLCTQIFLGLLLLTGFGLARKKKFRAHGICQSSVVLFNLVPIFSLMIPQYREQVLPDIQFRAARLVPFAHGILGMLVEILALYVILNAGTNLLPKFLKFQNYKVWMRTTLALWWITI